MTPVFILGELLDRLAVISGCKILLSSHDLGKWSNAAVVALKKQKLLTRAPPAASVTCEGCEQHCCMPVNTVENSNGNSTSFVVCVKRDDTSRISVLPSKLGQWKCSLDAVCDFVAGSLGLRTMDWKVDDKGLWQLGVVTGDARCQMLCLEAAADVLILVAATAKVPLADFLVFDHSVYSLNIEMVRRLVDSSTTADERYTPNVIKRENRKLDTQVMYASWQKEYRKLQKQSPNKPQSWYAKKIAKMPIAQNRDAETIRKRMTQ